MVLIVKFVVIHVLLAKEMELVVLHAHPEEILQINNVFVEVDIMTMGLMLPV